MDQATHNKIVSFIWGIADDVLRDLFRRGKYPDVILPMCVIRRMDAVLEPTKQNVLDTKAMLDAAGITEQRTALCDAAGQAFYNTSKFTLRDLKSRGSQQRLLADFEDYLNGFSPNVQDILENFKFRNQLQTLSKADAIGTLINKFLDPDIDLSPAGIDNHSMGTVFEELVRKFNEDNNEEAGEHWTPRDAVRLMANLVFLPVEDQIKSGTYLQAALLADGGERFLGHGEHAAGAAGVVEQQVGTGFDLGLDRQKHQVGHQPHRVARRPVLAGLFVVVFVELAHQFLEHCAHGVVVDAGRREVDVGVKKLVDQRADGVGLGQRVQLVAELEVLQDVLDIGREAVEIIFEIGQQLLMVAARLQVTQGEA